MRSRLSPVLLAVLALVAVAGSTFATPASPASSATADPGPADPSSASSGPSGPVAEAASPRSGLSARARANPDRVRMSEACYSPQLYDPRKHNECHLSRRYRNAPTIVVWGDSHALHDIPALRASVKGKRVNLVGFVAGGCPILDPHYTNAGQRSRGKVCPRTGDAALRYLRWTRKHHQRVRVVVGMAWELYHDVLTPRDALDQEYPGYRDDYMTANAKQMPVQTVRAFKVLGRLGIRTDIVTPMPMVPQNTTGCRSKGIALGCTLPRRAVLKDEDANQDMIDYVRSFLRRKGRLIRFSEAFCWTSSCHGTTRGLPTYYNRLHVGARVSARMGPKYFGPVVSSLLRHSRG